MVALYINSHIGCGLFCSWHVCQLQKICSDTWDCVKSYAIPMFLAPGQKITFTSNPKLIISVLILILLLPSFKLLSPVASTMHAALNLAYLLEVGQQAWCTISKFTYQEWPTSSSYDPQASGTGTDFLAIQARVLVLPSLRWAFHEQETLSIFFSTRKQKSYYWQATYEDHFPTVPQRNAASSVQATYCLNDKFVTRATYNEPHKICPQGTQPTRMQAN